MAAFRAPIEAAGFAIERVDVAELDWDAVDLVAPDLLVMMGGPMGVYDADAHPWIACQLRGLRRRLALDRPTLGVCLGAQMIAAALGARVYRGPSLELGFQPVELRGAADAGPLRHIAGLPVLHWHGDTFDLPDGAELLASSALYRHQAFRRGRNVLALQFHAEMGRDPRFDRWLATWPDAVASTGRTCTELRHEYRCHGPATADAGQAMIAEWLAGLSLDTPVSRAP